MNPPPNNGWIPVADRLPDAYRPLWLLAFNEPAVFAWGLYAPAEFFKDRAFIKHWQYAEGIFQHPPNTTEPSLPPAPERRDVPDWSVLRDDWRPAP